MLWWQNIPFITILLSMLTAIISAVLNGKAAKILSLSVMTAISAASAVLLFNVSKTGEAFTYLMGHFPAPWGNEIRAGVLESMLAVFFSIIMILALIGGMKHVEEDIEPSKLNLYFVMTDLMLGAVLAMIYTNDIFTGYVFIEILTLSTCAILIIRQIGATTLAAVRYMCMSLLGSGLFLIGVTLTFDLTGHLLMPNMKLSFETAAKSGEYAIPILMCMLLMTIGLAIKSGLFPFHFWMPDTYGYATPASGSILSGIVSKAYIIMLIKIYFRIIGLDILSQSHIRDVLFIFGLAGIIFGSLSAIREQDIRRMVAFSSAAQIGYVFTAISFGTEAGFVAAIFHILTHALTKPLLFLSASKLSDVSGGSKKFDELQGSGRRNIIAGIGFTAGALSMVGMPILSGFITKLLIGTASLENPYTAVPTLIVLAISTVLNSIYFLKTVITIYYPERHPFEPKADTERSFLARDGVFAVVVAVFIALNVFLGTFSHTVTDAISAGLSMFG